MERTKIATAAMERSDRYLREFVEALHLCPFARRCREDGKLHRRVLLAGDDAMAAVSEVEGLPAESVEVALLIFPQSPTGSPETARAFEAFTTSLRDHMSQTSVDHTSQTSVDHTSQMPVGRESQTFYCVAFHPDFPRDLGDAHRAVPFIRRSPDPTIQLVRASVLRAVRGENNGERYVDPSKLTLEQMMALTVPISTSDRIAEANLATLQREDPARVESLLTSLRL
jgi:hypothetical protein